MNRLWLFYKPKYSLSVSVLYIDSFTPCQLPGGANYKNEPGDLVYLRLVLLIELPALLQYIIYHSRKVDLFRNR